MKKIYALIAIVAIVSGVALVSSRMEKTQLAPESELILDEANDSENMAEEDGSDGALLEGEEDVFAIKEDESFEPKVPVLATVVTKKAPATKTVEASSYACTNEATVRARAYVVLLGLNDDDAASRERDIRAMTAGDGKAKAFLIYDYVKNDSLVSISEDFVSKLNEFIERENPDELIIFGRSAGGTIASYSANKIKAGGRIELHTIASPLRGYGISGILGELFLGEKRGLEREIGEGFGNFVPAPDNWKVFHHKTVTDSLYASQCGDFAAFCDPKKIQNNNLTGAAEYYYSQYDHADIMDAIETKVASCRK